jgi:hypothetical protein
MSPLEAQKRLLIAESELNRAQLARSLAGLGGVATIVAGAAHVESLFSSLVAVLGLGRADPAPVDRSGLLGNAIAVGSSLWRMFRRRG